MSLRQEISSSDRADIETKQHVKKTPQTLKVYLHKEPGVDDFNLSKEFIFHRVSQIFEI